MASVLKPAMSYSRAGRTTIGPGCLSAVFGMGTGVSTRAWPPASSFPTGLPGGAYFSGVFISVVCESRCARLVVSRGWAGVGAVRPSGRLLVPVRSVCRHTCTPGLSTRCSPGSLRLSAGGPILGGVSRLYAFSAYPFRTWLPGGAASATTGTPAVRPSQSSRTRDEAPQASSARSR